MYGRKWRGNEIRPIHGLSSLCLPGQLTGVDEWQYTSKACSKKTQPPYLTSRKGSILEHDRMFDYLFDENGEIKPKGSIIKRSEYAEVLKRIAAEGADAFYAGKMAEGIAKEAQAQGGMMTIEDLKSEPNGNRVSILLMRTDYWVQWLKPIKSQYEDKTLWTVPAPASGTIWAHALGILSNLDVGASGSTTDSHRLIETFRASHPSRNRYRIV